MKKLDETKRTEIIKRLYEEDHPIERVDQINRNMSKWDDYGFVNSLVNLLNIDWRPNSWISGVFKDQQVFEGESLWCIDELTVNCSKIGASRVTASGLTRQLSLILTLCSSRALFLILRAAFKSLSKLDLQLGQTQSLSANFKSSFL